MHRISRLNLLMKKPIKKPPLSYYRENMAFGKLYLKKNNNNFYYTSSTPALLHPWLLWSMFKAGPRGQRVSIWVQSAECLSQPKTVVSNCTLEAVCEGLENQPAREAGRELSRLHSETLRLFCLEDHEPVCLVCCHWRVHANHNMCLPELQGYLEEACQVLHYNLLSCVCWVCTYPLLCVW